MHPLRAWSDESVEGDNPKHRLIEGADHSALILDEEHAAATSDAILDVLASIRDEEPLAR